MKKLFTLLLITAVLGMAHHVQAQRSVKKLFCEAKKEGYSFAITVPGWLARKGLNLVTKHTMSEDKDKWMSLVDNIKGVRFLLNENCTAKQRDLLKSFAAHATQNDFQLYASFAEGKNKVQLFVEEKKEKIKNLLFLINGEQEAIIVQIKTDLSLSELEQQNFSFKKNNI